MASFHQIRKAREADIPFIMALEAGPDAIYVHAYDEETHTANLADSHTHYLIAEDTDKNPIGYAILFDDGRERIEWRRIITATPGGGVGQAFMAAVVHRFQARGAKLIWLDVYEDNHRARHVYGKLGFKEVRREPYDGEPPGTLVIMECALTD